MSKIKIAIGSDHNGIELKNFLISSLKNKYAFFDIGPYETIKTDYTDISYQLSKLIELEYVDKGILICGTGVGMSISANRNPNINAALVQHRLGSKLAIEHNNSNVLCLSSWINTKKTNLDICNTWLSTKFLGGRHLKRLGKISKKKEISVVSGIFDIIHQGHIDLLNYAKSLANNLVVLINSDKSVKKLYKNRPILNEKTRKQLLESFSIVKEVIIFDDLSPGSLINEIKPDYFIRGSEHTVKQIRTRDKINDEIKIKIFPINNEYSNQKIVKKIRKIRPNKLINT